MSDLKSKIGDPQSLDLEIEALVLYGFAPVNRDGIGNAVERELMRLFSQDGIALPRGEAGDIEQLNGRSIQVARGANEEAIGVQVAQAVYGALRSQSLAPAKITDSSQQPVDSASPKSG